MHCHGVDSPPRYALLRDLFARIRAALARQKVSPETFFTQLDTSRDGYLDRREIERFVKLFQPDITFQELDIVFESLTKSRSGLVSANDFYSALAPQSVFSAPRQQNQPRARSAPMGHRSHSGRTEQPSTMWQGSQMGLIGLQPARTESIIGTVADQLARTGWTFEDLFHKLNLDGDGTLNTYEMERFLKAFVPDISPRDCSCVFAYFDVHRSGRVSIHNFCTTIFKHTVFGPTLQKSLPAPLHSDTFHQSSLKNGLLGAHERARPPSTHEQWAKLGDFASSSPARRGWPLPDHRLLPQSGYSPLKQPSQHAERYPFSVPKQLKPTSYHRGKALLGFRGIDAFKIEQHLRAREAHSRHEPTLALEEAAFALVTESKDSRSFAARRYAEQASQQLLEEFGKPTHAENEHIVSIENDFELARQLQGAEYRGISGGQSDRRTHEAELELKRHPIPCRSEQQQEKDDAAFARKLQEEEVRLASPQRPTLGAQHGQHIQVPEIKHDVDLSNHSRIGTLLEHQNRMGGFRTPLRTSSDTSHGIDANLLRDGEISTRIHSIDIAKNGEIGNQVQSDAEFALRLQQEELGQVPAESSKSPARNCHDTYEFGKKQLENEFVAVARRLPEEEDRLASPQKQVNASSILQSLDRRHEACLSSHHVGELRSALEASSEASHSIGANLVGDEEISTRIHSVNIARNGEIENQLESDAEFALKLQQEELGQVAASRSTALQECPKEPSCEQKHGISIATRLLDSNDVIQGGTLHNQHTVGDTRAAYELEQKRQEKNDAALAQRLQEEEDRLSPPQGQVDVSSLGAPEVQNMQQQDIRDKLKTPFPKLAAYSKHSQQFHHSVFENHRNSASKDLPSGERASPSSHHNKNCSRSHSGSPKTVLSGLGAAQLTRFQQRHTGSPQVLREQLVMDIYKQEGLDLNKAREQAMEFLKDLGLAIVDAGHINTAGSRSLRNQCFYLSLARSHLGPSDKISRFALLLKQIIEFAALSAHPEWSDGIVGTEVQAFSDFLWYPMRDKSCFLSEFAAAIMDSTTGWIELYKGVNHEAAIACDAGAASEKLFMLWHIPGHYQCLAADDAYRSKPRMTLHAFKTALDSRGIAYVETTE